MYLIIRDHVNKFTSNRKISKTTTMQDIMEWNSMEKNLDHISCPITKPKSNESFYIEMQVSNITSLVDTMIIPLPKIREQKVSWSRKNGTIPRAYRHCWGK